MLLYLICHNHYLLNLKYFVRFQQMRDTSSKSKSSGNNKSGPKKSPRVTPGLRKSPRGSLQTGLRKSPRGKAAPKPAAAASRPVIHESDDDDSSEKSVRKTTYQKAAKKTQTGRPSLELLASVKESRKRKESNDVADRPLKTPRETSQGETYTEFTLNGKKYFIDSIRREIKQKNLQ